METLAAPKPVRVPAEDATRRSREVSPQRSRSGCGKAFSPGTRLVVQAACPPLRLRKHCGGALQLPRSRVSPPEAGHTRSTGTAPVWLRARAGVTVAVTGSAQRAGWTTGLQWPPGYRRSRSGAWDAGEEGGARTDP